MSWYAVVACALLSCLVFIALRDYKRMKINREKKSAEIYAALLDWLGEEDREVKKEKEERVEGLIKEYPKGWW